MWIEANFLQNLGPSNRLLPFGEMTPRRKLVLMERRSSVRKLATVDANGNMTVDELGNELTYDAWNRLVKVADSGSAVLAEYAYDALMRRIAGHDLDLYYSQNWQVLEDFPNGQSWASARYVWPISAAPSLSATSTIRTDCVPCWTPRLSHAARVLTDGSTATRVAGWMSMPGCTTSATGT